MKKLIAIMTTLLLLCSLTLNVAAEESFVRAPVVLPQGGVWSEVEVQSLPSVPADDQMSLSVASTYTNIFDCIFDQASQGAEMVDDLMSFSCPVDGFVNQWNDFLYRNPQLFIDRELTAVYSYGTVVAAIELQYIIDVSELETARQTIDTMTDHLIASVSDLEPLGQLLVLHDYIADYCGYDYQNAINNTLPRTSYSIYGVFVNRTAVCQGYAEAYGYLLTKLGIEHHSCCSNELNHIWNYVKLDGKFYLTDVTWDDPVSGSTLTDAGLCQHDYFMNCDTTTYNQHCSAQGIDAFTAYSYDMTDLPDCEDATYESGYVFNDVNYPITFAEGVYTNYRFGMVNGYLYHYNQLKMPEILMSEPFLSSSKIKTVIVWTDAGYSNVYAFIRYPDKSVQRLAFSNKAADMGTKYITVSLSEFDTTKTQTEAAKIMAIHPDTLCPASFPVSYQNATE